MAVWSPADAWQCLRTLLVADTQGREGAPGTCWVQTRGLLRAPQGARRPASQSHPLPESPTPKGVGVSAVSTGGRGRRQWLAKRNQGLSVCHGGRTSVHGVSPQPGARPLPLDASAPAPGREQSRPTGPAQPWPQPLPRAGEGGGAFSAPTFMETSHASRHFLHATLSKWKPFADIPTQAWRLGSGRTRASPSVVRGVCVWTRAQAAEGVAFGGPAQASVPGPRAGTQHSGR